MEDNASRISAGSQNVQVSRVASVIRLPHYTIKLGSFGLGTSTSNYTLQNQSLPLAVEFVAARGCNGLILDLVTKWYQIGVMPKARTGAVV